MRRVLLGVLVALLIACAMTTSGIVVRAQTLPVTKALVWTPRPASEAITAYTVTLDGGTPIMVDPMTCAATCTQPVTFTTAAQHTLSLTATNVWGTGPPSTLTVTVIVPGAPTGLRIQ